MLSLTAQDTQLLTTGLRLTGHGLRCRSASSSLPLGTKCNAAAPCPTTMRAACRSCPLGARPGTGALSPKERSGICPARHSTSCLPLLHRPKLGWAHGATEKECTPELAAMPTACRGEHGGAQWPRLHRDPPVWKHLQQALAAHMPQWSLTSVPCGAGL